MIECRWYCSRTKLTHGWRMPERRCPSCIVLPRSYNDDMHNEADHSNE